MGNRWIYYCPKNGLEHVMLEKMAWKVDHTVIIDREYWVCIIKPKTETELEHIQS